MNKENQNLKMENDKPMDNSGKIDPAERLEEMRIKHAQEKKKWKENYNKLANQNIDLVDRMGEIEDRLTETETKNKVLDKQLWRERRQSSSSDVEKELSEGQKVGLMALEIVKKRYSDRYKTNR